MPSLGMTPFEFRDESDICKTIGVGLWLADGEESIALIVLMQYHS